MGRWRSGESSSGARLWPTSPPSASCTNARSARGELAVEQLQAALDSRILIELANGVLAERLRLTVADAFTLLRGHARSTKQRLVIPDAAGPTNTG